MAGIKISDLPPNTLPLVGDEKMELENADGDSTQATVADVAAAASGLDASFITVDPNAQLPNERVLTAGTNVSLVDTGPNGTLTINATGGLSFPLLAPDGSAGIPSYSWATAPTTGIHLIASNLMGFSILGTTNWEMGGLFQAANNAGPAMSNTVVSATVPGLLPAQQDPNTGIGSNTLDQLSLIAGGAEIARATAAFNANQFALIQSGSTSVPELTSLADPDTGFRWTGSNQVVWIGGGSRAWNFSTARFFSQFSNGPSLENLVATNTVPSILPDQGDSNTGIGHPSGSDEMSLIAGGVEAVRIDETAGSIQVIVDPGLTNTSDATPPLAFGGGTVGFRSPDSDQLFVILSGAAQWRFTTADFNANITDGPALRFVTPSDTVPSLLPNQNDTDTGIGQNAADEVSLIGGGVELARAVAAASGGLLANNTLTGAGLERVLTVSDISGFPDPLLLSDGSVSAPSYSFASDPDSGMWLEGADRLSIGAGGLEGIQVLEAASIITIFTRGIVVGQGGFRVGQGNGGMLIDENASGTNPTLLPSQSDFDTGIGWAGGAPADSISVIAGGVEMIRVNEGAANQVILEPADATPGTAAAPALQLGSGANGFFLPFTNQISVAIGGVDTWKFTTATLRSSTPTTGPGLVNAGTVSLTSVGLAPLADNIGTGVGSDGPNTLSLVVDDRIAVLYDEATGRIVQTNSSEIGLTASITQTQAGGLLLRSSYNEIATVANTGDAITAFAVAQAMRLVVVNNGANDLQLFPAVGDDFGAGVDTAITIAAGAIGIFLGRTAVIWDTLFNGAPSPSAGQVANDAAQARRTTIYVLTTAFVDITMDVTDIETDAAVIDHDLVTNTDNIIFGAAGTYEVTYDMEVISTAVSGDPIIDMGCRVRLNDAGTGIAGSLANPYAFRDGSVGGDDGNFQIHVSNTFLVTVVATDFITLQLDKTELSGSDPFNVSKICMKVRRLL